MYYIYYILSYLHLNNEFHFHSLPTYKTIDNFSQIQPDDFGYIMIQICNKIIQVRGMEINFPEKYIKMNRYADGPKIVDFLKNLGYKSKLDISNIISPTMRDFQRLFEFTLEIISSNETAENELGDGLASKNFAKIKIGKQLQSWNNQIWMVPELNQDIRPKVDTPVNEYLLKIPNSKISALKKFRNANAGSISEFQNKIAKSKTQFLQNSTNINFVQEDENTLKYVTNESNHNYIVNKIKEKNKTKPSEKTNNILFLECLDTRNKAIDFLYGTYTENNFINNVQIIKKKNKILYSTINLQNASGTNNKETEGTEEENKQNIYQSKLETIISNFEKEKQQKNEEIIELNNKLLSVQRTIENLKQKHEDNENERETLEKKLNDLSDQNQDLLKDIEDQMTAYEQMKKLQQSEMAESDIVVEVQQLQKKYESMVNDWEEYSVQAKARVEELKTEIDTKKKEYNYKYEQISTLKKEIEDITSKIAMKQEMAAFLREESEKIPTDINRNHYIARIAEFTRNIKKEKGNIVKYNHELILINGNITQLNEKIKAVDNELEDTLFQDAKQYSKLNPVYKSFISLRDGYNTLQKNILEMSIQKNRLKDIENKLEDFKLKIANYDYQQLKEQVELLKQANEQK